MSIKKSVYGGCPIRIEFGIITLALLLLAGGAYAASSTTQSTGVSIAAAEPAPTVTATPPPGTDIVQVTNSYIGIVVAPPGTYVMGTTGGDPNLTTSANKALLYGYPATPWTSYLTVRIDGTDYYTKVTSMDAYRVSGPISSDNVIYTVWRIGDIGIIQKILPTNSSTTGREDTALFKVSLVNYGSVAHSAGARFLFDTMLGSNDAAPFKVPGVGDVTTEREFNGSDVPAYFQAFDSLSSPTIFSQGTLSISPPNRFIMANWRHLYDAPWNYSVQWGVRNGDSAFAVYWNPVVIQPGGNVEYSTAYGLGGVTVSPGILSLGISSPTNVTSGDAFTITAYIQNTATMEVMNISSSLVIPSGLVLVPGETSVKHVEDLAPGAQAQVSWNVQAAGTGAMNVTVSVSGSNVPATSASRIVNVASVQPSNGSVTRSISPSTVQQGNVVNITLIPSPSTVFNQPGYQVTEVIPQGFTFIGTAVGVIHAGNLYTFTQIGSGEIDYSLTAPLTNGTYPISGTFKDDLGNTGVVSGTASINVTGTSGTGGDLLTRYDSNHDGRIERNEAIQAVTDYFAGIIIRLDAITVVTMYFTG
ncbi:Uncharacterised protein [uncultured archaeon]|nr:Uncharacterised protein [uncultured archaeon]